MAFSWAMWAHISPPTAPGQGLQALPLELSVFRYLRSGVYKMLWEPRHVAD